MSIGSPVAADVPSLFDVVINGKGYIFLRTIDTSLPFRTQRAKYSRTATFLERTNVTGAYSDNQQDFFLTASQNDWSLGDQQRFYRPGNQESTSRFWDSKAVDVSVQGQVTLRSDISTITFAAAIVAATGGATTTIFAVSTTNLYEIDPAGAITDRGAHGAGTPNGPRCMVYDGSNVYIAGGTKLRKWNGAAFSDFSASTIAVALMYSNNTLYSLASGGAGLTNSLKSYSTGGVETNLYTWRDATGGSPSVISDIEPFGGKFLILRGYGDQVGADLWIYDGTGVFKIATFPRNFQGNCITVANGVVFVAGVFSTGNSPAQESAIFYYSNGTFGLLWRSRSPSTSNVGLPVIGEFQGYVIWTDEDNNRLVIYDPTNGGTSVIGTLAGSGSYNTNGVGIGSRALLVTRNATNAYFFPATTIASTGYISTSQFDFDNSLIKQFRGIKIDWELASDGNGGSMDIAYQADSVDGSYTNLQTGATTGTEYTLSGVSGHTLSVKITLNKGTSTNGPKLKRIYVRASPQLQSYRNCEYMLDCSGTRGVVTAGSPVILNDNETPHPLTGLQQAVNLNTSIAATTPFSVSDRFGTYNAVIEPSVSELIEISPEEYIARISVREV